MKKSNLLLKFNVIWLLRKLKTWTQKIFCIEDSPEKIARGFALGSFIGMTPFIGLQFFISVWIARILNWNKIAAGIAVFHTNVFTGTFIIGFNYTLGAAIIGSDIKLDFSNDTESFMILNIFNSGISVFSSLFIGGIVTGIPAAFVAYVLLKKIFHNRQKLNTTSHGNVR